MFCLGLTPQVFQDSRSQRSTERWELSVKVRRVAAVKIVALPQHLWSQISQYHEVADSLAVMQSTRCLHEAFQSDAVWQNHSVASGVSRFVTIADVPFALHQASKANLASLVNWRMLLQLNIRANCKSAVWVRLSRMDLKLPLSSRSQDNVRLFMGELARVVQIAGGLVRLRALQWGGRPGRLLPKKFPLAGSCVMLEWASPNPQAWPLPPNSQLIYEGGTAILPARPQVAPLFRALRSCIGIESEDSQRVVMLRIVTTLVPKELWVQVNVDTTVGQLCADLAALLKRESLHLASSSQQVHIRFTDAESVHALHSPEVVLRSIFWAESETVIAQLAHQEQQDQLLVRVWRARAFPKQEGEEQELSCDFSDASAGWRRQVSDPLPGRPTTVEGQLPSDPLASSGWARQATEPSPESGGDSWLGGILDHCSPPQTPLHLPGMSILSSAAPTTPASSAHRMAVPPVHPGDIAVDYDDDPAAAGGGEALRQVLPTDCVGSVSAGNSWEWVLPHYAPRLLPQTAGTRQFEFHPTMPEIMLIGDKKGGANVVDIDTEEAHPALQVASCPLLGLVWMQHHPQVAVCGAAQSGQVVFMKYNPQARASEPALHSPHHVEEFPKLSSLSANCTDDFLLASGVSPNIAIYDVHTGAVLQRANGVHEHFINISRFCHTSPHIFATASFDHTCKVWDLRTPLRHDRPVKILRTGGRNVMCVFSPDDKHLLCSGVDTRIVQFEVPSWRQSPDNFPLREPVERERFRRSTYMADGRHFVTAATDESHMHVMSTSGQKIGVVDFRGMIRNRPASFESDRIFPPVPSNNPYSIGSLQMSALWDRRPSFPRGSLRPGLLNHAYGAAQRAAALQSENIVRGAIQIDDGERPQGQPRCNHEFVQSLRTHPKVVHRIGALVALTQSDSAYVAILDLACR